MKLDGFALIATMMPHLLDLCTAVMGLYHYIYIYIPIGSMYSIYGNIYHQYTPVMLAYIPYMDPSWDKYIILIVVVISLVDEYR